MSLRFDQWASPPGLGSAVETYESAIRWGAFNLGVIVPVQIDGSARDSGASPTSMLRPGLILGQLGSNLKYRDYGDNNSDGSNVAGLVLLEPVRMTDFDGNNQDKFYYALAGGPVQAANLIGLTEQARAQMAGRFLFDDRGYIPNTFGWRQVVAKTAAYTVVNGTDNNTIFTTTGNAGSLTFTLPTTIQKGQRWKFVNTVGQTMIVAAPAGKLVTFNNAAATSVAFQTAGNLIGGSFEITVDETAAKYVVMPSGANTVTVA